MVIFVAVISSFVAFLVAKSIFGDIYKGSAKIKTIESIESTLSKPSEDIFSEYSINPAVKVEISADNGQ